MQKTIIANVIALVLALTAQAQLTIQVPTFPSNTPADATIYMTGTINGWDPGDETFALTFVEDQNVYQITLDIPAQQIFFKFTRGSFATVEGDNNGNFIPDRVLDYDGTEQTVVMAILGWEDLPGLNSTAAENVDVIAVSFEIPQLDRERRIWVYLPPDYSTSPDRYYPVMYMQDGQNLFDVLSAFAGEWEVDESLNTLFENGDDGIIIIGIDNGGINRINEYSPWENPNFGGGEGDEYVQFLVETLKPYVDANYRVLEGPENTGIMGSSMGGLISMYAAIKHQDVFGKAGIFSPSFWFSDEIFNFVNATGKTGGDMRIYLMGGETESATLVQELNQMRTTLTNVGFSDQEVNLVTHADGQHAEWYWGREFPAAYLWLFGDVAAGTSSVDPELGLHIAPNPADSVLLIEIEKPLADLQVEIRDIQGRVIQARRQITSTTLDVHQLPSGNYFLMIFDGIEYLGAEKFIKK